MENKAGIDNILFGNNGCFYYKRYAYLRRMEQPFYHAGNSFGYFFLLPMESLPCLIKNDKRIHVISKSFFMI
jgi:hypothetical protein